MTGDDVLSDDDLKLTDPQFFAHNDPHPIWTRLRAIDPVHWTNSNLGRNFWSVTRLADVQEVLKNAELFSSQLWGPSLPSDPALVDPKRSEHARLAQSGAMLVSLDPPRHTLARAPFPERFTPRIINGLEGHIRRIVTKILDDMEGRDECDFVQDIAALLPIGMIFLIMDVPEEDWGKLFGFANMLTAPEDPEFSVGTPLETKERGARGIFEYCRDLGLRRRDTEANDLLSLIANMRVEGERLSEGEVGLMGSMFVVAGQETTRNSLSGGLLELIRNPAEWRRLQANPELLKTLPDEFVRWANPVTHLMRTATEDTVLGGKTIRKGDWVVLWMASANRDESVFVDPFKMDVGRFPNFHIGFGYGPHFCLGNFLGRLQIRVMMELLLERFDSLSLADEPEFASTIQLCGLKHLKVKLNRQAAMAG
jgi:cholest-4-en-3-one 26-monooxygenase